MYTAVYTQNARAIAWYLSWGRLRVTDLPRFGKPLNNLTVSVGREAIFTCIVEDLGPYKVRRSIISPGHPVSTHGCSHTLRRAAVAIARHVAHADVSLWLALVLINDIE